MRLTHDGMVVSARRPRPLSLAPHEHSSLRKEAEYRTCPPCEATVPPAHPDLGRRAHLRISTTRLVFSPIRTTSVMHSGGTISSCYSARRLRLRQNGILLVTMSFAIVRSPRKL
jgi:hypothetical protein